jgi:hypothetical protein
VVIKNKISKANIMKQIGIDMVTLKEKRSRISITLEGGKLSNVKTARGSLEEVKRSWSNSDEIEKKRLIFLLRAVSSVIGFLLLSRLKMLINLRFRL